MYSQSNMTLLHLLRISNILWQVAGVCVYYSLSAAPIEKWFYIYTDEFKKNETLVNQLMIDSQQRFQIYNNKKLLLSFYEEVTLKKPPPESDSIFEIINIKLGNFLQYLCITESKNSVLSFEGCRNMNLSKVNYLKPQSSR